MNNKGRTTPRIVCCAIPIKDGKVLLVTGRKRKENWVLPKGGFELLTDKGYEAAAQREAFEEAGVIESDVIAKVLEIRTDPTEYHFFELAVTQLGEEWPEREERDREWYSIGDALDKLEWKKELWEGLAKSSLGPCADEVVVAGPGESSEEPGVSREEPGTSSAEPGKWSEEA